jgi:hypothetical protein
MTNPLILSYARDLKLDLGAQSVKDKFSFSLDRGDQHMDNTLGETGMPTPFMEEQDLIRVYMKKDPVDDYAYVQDDIIFEGTVRQVAQKLDDSGNICTVEGFNWFEVFFDVEIPIGGSNYTDKTCMEMLRYMIENQLSGTGINIGWDPSNPTFKQDGVTSFPQKSMSLNYTPIFMIIEKLSSNEYTSDGQYTYYISRGTDGRNLFSIRAQTGETEDLVLSDEVIPIETVDINRGSDNVRNYIIYNCGIDLYGVSVEWYYFNSTSIGKYGWKTYFAINETGNIFSALLSREITDKKSSFTFDAQGNLTSPFPASYPYTFAFNSAISAANAAEYNQKLREEALAQGLQKARAIADNYNTAYYLVDLTMPWRGDLVLGALYSVSLKHTRPSFPATQIRLKNLSITSKNVVASFDQDIKDRTLYG